MGQPRLSPSPLAALPRRSSSSEPSSIMVRSAEKSVSNTYSKPTRRSAQARRSTVASSRGMPSSSPQALRTAGAICTSTILSGSAMASNTVSVSSRSRRAPVGQCVMHWPHATQSVLPIGARPRVPTAVCVARLVRSQIPKPCTLSHTLMQRMHLMHLSLSRMMGKSKSQPSRARCCSYGR